MMHFRARGVAVQSDKIFLAHHLGGKGHYFLPGGHIEDGEAARRTVEREYLEETGLTVTATDFLFASEHAYVDEQGQHAEINLIFKVEGDIPTEPTSAEEHLEFVWVAAADLHTINFLPTQFIPPLVAYIEGRAVPSFHSTIRKE
ncbi:MAG: NUDIX domain-containing protein [Patescibacteria group bacterium]